MSLWIFLCAAALLSLERICYLWIWRAPGDFCALCARPAITRIGTPVDVLQFLFCGFKILQCAVFLAWCFVYGNGSLWPPSSDPLSLTLGAALLIGGQILNISVFYRLGKVGVFYGNKFGYPTSLGAQVSVFVFKTSPVYRRFAVHLGVFLGDAFSPGRLVYPARTRNAVLRSRRVLGAIIGNLRDPVQWASMQRLLSASISQACKHLRIPCALKPSTAHMDSKEYRSSRSF